MPRIGSKLSPDAVSDTIGPTAGYPDVIRYRAESIPAAHVRTTKHLN